MRELDFSKRSFLKSTLRSSSFALLPILISACSNNQTLRTLISNNPNVGNLLPPDINGLMLPKGFSSRIVAISSEYPSSKSSYRWHGSPDGGATFATDDGGWIYVSNAELSDFSGGVGVLKFNSIGDVIDSYSILSGTSRNCAGGPSPWGSWFSCEEIPTGLVYECDPLGVKPAVQLSALGSFKHEAVAIDPVTFIVYLTEDRPDGNLYRFIPNSTSEIKGDYSHGTLEAMEVIESTGGNILWHKIEDPSAIDEETRYQNSNSTEFNGGEGIWYFNHTIYFSTKGDNRVWQYNIQTESIDILYDANHTLNTVLTGVDNLLVTDSGNVLVAEDGGDMQIVAITSDKKLIPIVQVVGHHPNSEITGPAFSPSRDRLYFSSQNGISGSESDGITFEVRGPFVV